VLTVTPTNGAVVAPADAVVLPASYGRAVDAIRDVTRAAMPASGRVTSPAPHRAKIGRDTVGVGSAKIVCRPASANRGSKHISGNKIDRRPAHHVDEIRVVGIVGGRFDPPTTGAVHVQFQWIIVRRAQERAVGRVGARVAIGVPKGRAAETAQRRRVDAGQTSTVAGESAFQSDVARIIASHHRAGQLRQRKGAGDVRRRHAMGAGGGAGVSPT
jgi:hypothetical protein